MILFICSLISFFITLILVPKIIKYLKSINLEVKDMNKEKTPLVPVSGGLAVFAGIFIGVMCFIFIQTFFYNVPNNIITPLLAALISILIITAIGFIDDLLIGPEKERSVGLKQWQKPLLVLPAAIPLMVVNAGITQMSIPFTNIVVNASLLYPLFLVPIAVVGAANMVNLLAGFNGLEAGLGLVYTGMLGIYSYFNGTKIATLIAFITFGALLAFLLYNKVPAKILPGDSLTYLLGAVIASIAILGNIEKAALIVSIPFFIEFFLKLRGKFKPQSYGYYKEGKIYSKYKKVYSIPHFFTRTGKFTEKQVVLYIVLIELFFCSLIWVI